MISTIFSTISGGLTGSEWDTTLAIGRDLHGLAAAAAGEVT